MSELDLQRQISALQARLDRLASADAIRYATSTWTPTLSGTGTAGTFTYTAQSGLYTRLGNICVFLYHVSISGYSVAPTGSIRVLGFPFTSANLSGYWHPYVIETSGITLAASTRIITGYLVENSTTSYFLEATSGGADGLLPASAVPNAAARITGAGTYRIE